MSNLDWLGILLLSLVGLVQAIKEFLSPRFDKTKLKKFHWLGDTEDHRVEAPPQKDKEN